MSEVIDWDTVVDRAKDAKVGDIVIVQTPPSRYSTERLRRAVVTKVGRRWRYIDYAPSWGTDRYDFREREEQCRIDGGDYSQNAYRVFGALDWEEEKLRVWVRDALSAAKLRFDIGAGDTYAQRLAVANFLFESPLFDVPSPPDVAQ